MKFENDDGREPGFFFAVSGVPKKSNLRFHFPKLSMQHKLMSFGHKPVYLKVSKEEYQDLVSGKKGFYQQDWQRIPTEVEYSKDIGFVFEYPSDHDIKESDHLFFAYTYPFNENDIKHSIRQMQNKCLANDFVYFNKKTLIHSVEGRPME